MLSAILGLRIQVSAADRASFPGLYVATYNDDDGRLVALCVADVRFVARSGAALSMIAPEVAEEMIEADEVSDSILANFHEVMNICSRLLMKDSGGAHLRLDRSWRPDDTGVLVDSLPDGGRKLAFDLQLQGYGDGAMDYVVT